RLMTFGIILPLIANTSGRLLTEMGRQPWVVFGLMETSDAISPSVTANEMLISYIAFTSIYAILGAITIYLFVKHIKKEYHDDLVSDVAQDPFDDEERGAGIVS